MDTIPWHVEQARQLLAESVLEGSVVCPKIRLLMVIKVPTCLAMQLGSQAGQQKDDTRTCVSVLRAP
jgi:hypothetical protein